MPLFSIKSNLGLSRVPLKEDSPWGLTKWANSVSLNLLGVHFTDEGIHEQEQPWGAGMPLHFHIVKSCPFSQSLGFKWEVREEHTDMN